MFDDLIKNSMPKLIHYVPKYEDLNKIQMYFKDKQRLNFFIDFKNTLMWNKEENINDDEFIFKDENGSIIRSIDISIDEYDNLIQYFELILEQINEMNEKLT